jgi:hypothetical protein
MWKWLIGAGLVAAAALGSLLAANNANQQTPTGLYGQNSGMSGMNAVSESVFVSWQGHGADDFVVENAPANQPLPPPSGSFTRPDVILDLLVVWRWPGPIPPYRQSVAGSNVDLSTFVHRITGMDWEQRILFDAPARTIRVQNGDPVTLNASNVVVIDVQGERDAKIVQTLRVGPRFHLNPSKDEIANFIEQSPELAAYVNPTR